MEINFNIKLPFGNEKIDSLISVFILETITATGYAESNNDTGRSQAINRMHNRYRAIVFEITELAESKRIATQAKQKANNDYPIDKIPG